jgi:hypothetical protein
MMLNTLNALARLGKSRIVRVVDLPPKDRDDDDDEEGDEDDETEDEEPGAIREPDEC